VLICSFLLLYITSSPYFRSFLQLPSYFPLAHRLPLQPTADLPSLINHGLSALADTLQQDKHLTIANTSIAIIGPSGEAVEKVQGSGAARRGNFRIWENEDVDQLLRGWRRSRGEPEDGPQEGDAPQVQDGQQPGAAGAAGGEAVTTGDDDVTMAE
jgi:20S proteasome subunit alpha 6